MRRTGPQEPENLEGDGGTIASASRESVRLEQQCVDQNYKLIHTKESVPDPIMYFAYTKIQLI